MTIYRAEVRIGLKPGVADPEGANTAKALKLLGFESVQGVATSRLVLIDLEAKNQAEAKKAAEAMCRRLLTNPVIHAYDLTISRGPGPEPVKAVRRPKPKARRRK